MKSLFNYAVVLSRLGDVLAAMDHLQQVLVVEPGHQAARSALEQLRSAIEAG